MNKRTNNKLEFKTAMPIMKKSLLALSVVGTMAFPLNVMSATSSISGDATISADPAASTAIIFITDHTATVNDGVDITGVVTAGTDDYGTLDLSGTTTVSGQVGASGAELKAVDTGGTSKTATFSSDVHAITITADGTGTLDANGNLTGAVVFGTGAGTTGTITLAPGKIITGAVTTATNLAISGSTEGILTFETTASGTSNTLASTTIGAASYALKAVNVTVTDTANNADATATLAGNVFATTVTATATADSGGNTDTVEFDGTVTATTLNLDGAGAFTLSDTTTAAVIISGASTTTVAVNKGIVGAISNDSGAAAGTLVFSTTTSSQELASTAIGTSTAAEYLGQVTASSSNGTASFGGNVFATTITASATDSTGSDTVAFDGTVNATTLNLDGAGAFTLSDTVTAATVISGASTTTVAANKGFVGTVSNDSGAALGTLTFATTTTDTTLASSTIGTSAATGLTALNTTAAASTTATVTGAVYATTVTTAGAGTTSFGSTVNASTVNINGTSTLNMGGTLTTPALTSLTGATLNTNQYKVVSTGAIALNGTATWAVDINGTTTAGTDYGQISSSGAGTVTIADAATFTITPTIPSAVSSGTVVKIIDTAGGTDDLTYTSGSVSDITVTDTSKVLDYSLSESSEDLSLTISVASASSMGINSRHVNSVTNAISAISDGTDDSAWDAITSISTSVAMENAAEQLAPDAGATIGSALAAVSGVNNVIASRQTNTRVAFNTLGSQSGISTGDDANDAVVWAQIFSSSATQDKVGTIDGYDADSSGLALGWETDKSGDLLGLSVSYSDADVDGKSASASYTDTTAVQVSAYGTYGKTTDWMVGYASGDNDTKRSVNFGDLSLTASGKYDSDIFMAKVGHAFDSSQTGGWTITPKADLSWTNISNDGYTETGANAYNLVVASSSNDILTARGGAEFTQRTVDNGTVTIPHFNIMAGYDLNNDGGQTSSTFTGGGSAFTTKGVEGENASFQLGFGVDHVSDDTTVSFDLNNDLRENYNSLSGSLTFKAKF